MINDGEEVLVGRDGDYYSVECDGFELVACEIENLDLLVVGHCNPVVGACDSDDILPIIFPALGLLEVPFLCVFEELDSVLSVIGICDKEGVEVSIDDFLVDEDEFSGGFVFFFELDSSLILILCSFNQVPVVTGC